MDTLFFIASKVLLFIIAPESWIIFGLFATVVAAGRAHQTFASRLALLTLVLTLAITVLPIGKSLLLSLESEFPANPALIDTDGIIVLGGAEDAAGTARWKQTQLNCAAERFTEALVLARRFPNAKILFSGGSGSLRDFSSSDAPNSKVAERFFLEQGVEPNRLTFERLSRNTAENARFSYELVKPGNHENWVLITSASHMPRAMKSFKSVGWKNVTPFPVDYRGTRFSDAIGFDLSENLSDLKLALKEYLGLFVYRLTGR